MPPGSGSNYVSGYPCFERVVEAISVRSPSLPDPMPVENNRAFRSSG